MKNFIIKYNGNATRFKNLKTKEYANSEREAVEKFYKNVFDSNYYPSRDIEGEIRDSCDNIIAEPDDERIHYDGGFFYAEEIKCNK